MLSGLAAYLGEIRMFLQLKNVKHPELTNSDWLREFYYLVDMTEHLNWLSVKIQGVGNTILSLQQTLFALKNKLDVFVVDLETGRLLY